MSYAAWSTEGYGACLNDVRPRSAEDLKKLVGLAPKYAEITKDAFKRHENNGDLEDLVIDLAEDTNACGCGIAGILAQVILVYDYKKIVFIFTCFCLFMESHIQKDRIYRFYNSDTIQMLGTKRSYLC